MRRLTIHGAIALLALVAAGGAAAQNPQSITRSYEAEAQRAQPGFAGFSASRGQQFFRTTHGGQWSCASCHGEDPAAAGRHAVTGKAITPLAPAANPQRFTALDKTEKWFRRNCNDVLGRECTAAEKGDVVAWLTGLGR